MMHSKRDLEAPLSIVRFPVTFDISQRSGRPEGFQGMVIPQSLHATKRRSIRCFYAGCFELAFLSFETPKMAAPANRQATVSRVIFFFISEPPF